VVLIKAYEIQGCMLLCNAFNMYGLDHVVLVKLASTAVVSWLLGLTEDQTLAAISQVWMDGHALRVYRQKGNTIPRKGLTRDGQPGSPTPLSMPRWGFYANCFGNKRFELPKDYDSWVIENIIFKVMAVEGHGIASVEAALRQVEVLRSRNLNAETDITRIIIRTNAATDMIINKTGKLNNPADRDHCLQHLVALTFLKGKLPEAEDFLDGSSWSRSSEMDILRGKIEISVDEQFTRDYMDLNIKSVASGLAVECSNGLRLDEIVIHFPIGHGKNPKTLEVIKEKFHQNMGLMFSKDEVDEILALVNNEGAEEKPVSELLDLLVRESDISPKL
jgi:2-methylcitrate dehydratase